jgi:hypothetical protein
MRSKFLFTAATIAVAIAASFSMSVAARAQDARQAELVGFHQLCDHGDRKACVRFGMMLGEMKEHHAEWRRSHPEFWWWER